MRRKSERGSFTIEATLTLTLFMFAFMSILSLCAVVKVESITQYAIDQVAKEVAQYYYIAERVGAVSTDIEGVKEIDDTVQAIMDFADTSNTTVQSYQNNDMDALINKLNDGTLTNDVQAVTQKAQDVYNSFEPILQDPKGVISSLATMFTKQIKNELISRVIAQPLCKILLPKYITDGDADAMLEKMGVINGLDGLDFRMSSFISDGRSINVVVVYEIKPQGFGIFDKTFVIKQTASTAAWVTGTSLEKASEAESTWQKNDFERGKLFVAKLKAENPGKGVKGGKGIDLYDQKTNTFTSVHSMNVFSATYAEESGGTYTIKEKALKSKVKSYATTLNKNINKIDDSIIMEDGTKCQTALEGVKHRTAVLYIIVPEEAKSTQANLNKLNQIAKEIETETGVKVSFSYREKALEEKKAEGEGESGE